MSRHSQSGEGFRALALLTDAHGSLGGISQYNRDLLAALASIDAVTAITVVPRLAKGPLGPLPPKITYDLSGIGGLGRYTRAAASYLRPAGGNEIIICGHLNLVPVAWLLGRTRCAPVVLCIHGIDAWTPTPRLVANRLARRMDEVVSVSEVTRDRFIGWSGFPRSRTTILPNTVHAGEFGTGEKAPDLVARYNLDGCKVIMTFGRLVSEAREKGFDPVIAALPALIARDERICYLIAGDGPDRSRLEAKAARLRVARHCRFTGYVDAARKADILRLADAFVMPSKGEGFGIVLLEAMACGIPVVGSTKDGTGEALRGGDLGELVDPDDQGALVDGILSALAKPKQIPPGLDYFSFEQFTRRVHSLVLRVGGSATLPSSSERLNGQA